MSLQDISTHLTQVLEQLTELIEREKAQQVKKLVKYRFVYEQYFNQTGEWAPNDKVIEVSTMEDAFALLAREIDIFGVRLRNICYGHDAEMREEGERVRRYWQEQIEDTPRIREFTDKLTGVSLTVIDDSSVHPMLNLVCPEHHALTFEEVNSAISRLLTMAGLPTDALPLPFASSSSLPGEQQ